MRVLLTGGTGFLGSHVADALRARGDTVRATVRSSSNVTHLQGLGVELAEVSLESGAGLDEALRDIGAVIHCAGGGRVKGDEAFQIQNVKTTQTLLRAVERVRPNLRRFVHASSISAIPAHSLYGKAKRDAERLVLDASSRLPTTLLRLPALYGPRDTRWVALYKAVRRGVQPVFGKGAAMSLLYATDAASSLIAPLDREHPSGSIFAPEDGVPVTQAELGIAVGKVLGKKPIPIRIPSALLQAAAISAEWVGKRMNREVFLTRDKLADMLSDGWVCDSTPLRQELGWSSKVNLGEGTRLAGDWFRAEGLI